MPTYAYWNHNFSGYGKKGIQKNYILVDIFKTFHKFLSYRFVQFYISNELNNTGRDDIHLLPQCVIQAHASPFLLKKGSLLVNPLNRIIERAVESGLNDIWYRYSTPKLSTSPFSDIFPLSVHQFRSAFGILIIGTSIAIVTFIVELRLHLVHTARHKSDNPRNPRTIRGTEIKARKRKRKSIFGGRCCSNKYN